MQHLSILLYYCTTLLPNIKVMIELGAQPRLQSWGVQFLGLGYYYPSTEKKISRSTQFGAVGYIITLYSSKSYVKSWGTVQILGRSGAPLRSSSGCAHA